MKSLPSNMSSEDAYDIFEGDGDFSVRNDSSTQFTGKERCSECEHIQGVRFNNGNLFFCSIQKKYGGTFGKKIRKRDTACFQFKQADNKEIPVIDGYYGGQCQPTKR